MKLLVLSAPETTAHMVRTVTSIDCERILGLIATFRCYYPKSDLQHSIANECVRFVCRR